MKKKILATILALFMLLSAISIQSYAASPSIWYGAHVEGIGWMDSVKNGATAGTTGRSLRMEAIMVDLAGIDGGVTYRAHCANIGWMDWVTDQEVAGTTGQSRQMEAIEIKLTGYAESVYDVVYRAHVGNVGWMDWVKNGQTAGTTGRSLRMEAIEIKLVKKSGSSAGSGTSLPAGGSVQQFMTEDKWKVGTTWKSSHDSYYEPGMGKGCNAYCRDFVKYVYGRSLRDGSQYSNISEIRAGDCIYIDNGSKPHWMVVLGRNGDTLDLLHGNWTNGKVCRTSTQISGNTIYSRPFQYGFHY